MQSFGPGVSHFHFLTAYNSSCGLVWFGWFGFVVLVETESLTTYYKKSGHPMLLWSMYALCTEQGYFDVEIHLHGWVSNGTRYSQSPVSRSVSVL